MRHLHNTVDMGGAIAGWGQGDRVGLRLDTDQCSLTLYKNGEALDAGFPAGTITGPVVGAVELLCIGQALTLASEPPTFA